VDSAGKANYFDVYSSSKRAADEPIFPEFGSASFDMAKF